MTPILITPATADVVSLDDMKAHLRVDHSDEDALIASLTAAAVAHLDGYSGILGRAIMPQTWAQEWTCAGPYRLALPDVDADSLAVTVDGVTVTGFDTVLTPLGLVVTVATSGDLTRIEYDCAMPDHLLPAVQVAIKLLVGHWYATRETVGLSMEALPLAFDALIAPLRRVRI